MKCCYILILFLYTSVLSFSQNPVIPSSLNLRDISTSPEELLDSIDSIEKTGALSRYKLDYLRSYAYYSMNKYNRASIFADSALSTKDIKQDSTILFKTLVLAAESYAMSSRLMDAANIVNTVLSYSKRNNNTMLEANMMYVQGIIWRRMGLFEKSYNIINDAIKLLEKDDNIGTQLRICNIQGLLIDFYIDDKRYQKAWDISERYINLLKVLKGEEGVSARLIDRLYGIYYCKMAYLSQKMSRLALAEEYYNKYLATDMSSTMTGKLEINAYYLLIGRYQEVVDHNKEFYLNTDNVDTVSVLYRLCLLQSAQAYSGLGVYEKAYQCIEKYNRIIEAYRRMLDSNRLLELYQVTDNIKYEAKLESAQKELESRHRLIIALSILLVLVIVFTVYVFIERTKLKKNNRIISQLIVELNKNTEHLHSVNTLSLKTLGDNPEEVQPSAQIETIDNTNEDLHPSDSSSETDEDTLKISSERLFSLFDSTVKEQQLYLKYQLQRDDYAALMGVDRNRFASIIKEFTGDNLSSYLNDLRLNHSVTLFRTHPEMSINEVAEASAIPSMSTFYRVFKNKYGMSPKVFIEQLRG